MIHYRVATIKDLEDIYAVMVDTTFIHFKYGNVSKEAAIVHLKKEFFTSSLFSQTPVVIVGLLEGKIVCYSIFGSYKKYIEKKYPKETRKYAYSLGTGVLKNLSREGIGKELRLKTDEFAKHSGYVGMYTSVNETNIGSIKVQKRAGFQEIQKIHKPRRTEIIFKKDF